MNARWAFGLVATLVLAGTPALAQPLQVLGGNQVVLITTALPGLEPTPVVNTSTSLRYRRQSQISKITVSSACPGQRFTLRLRAVSVQDGNPAPSVTMVHGMPATDLIRNIPALVFIAFPRRATLEYTASSTFDQGNSAELGVDAHVVTFTLVAQ